MKKITSLLLTLVLMLSFCTCVSAQWVENSAYGISYDVSSDWIDKSYGNKTGFAHKTNSREHISIEAFDAEWAWSMEMVSESELKAICDELYSNSALANSLSGDNGGVYVTVISDSVLSRYETINNVTYYRYEKSYTAKASGYYDTSFYLTTYITVRNGKVYLFNYERDYDTNHFQDFAAMLAWMSYDLGEIKINIDGQRILPDTSPMILEGRTLVPIRAVAEHMNYYVDWDAADQVVTLVSADGSNYLEYQIGNTMSYKNGSPVFIDVPPVIVGGRTYLPLRAVAEAMNCGVNWDAATRTVLINR